MPALSRRRDLLPLLAAAALSVSVASPAAAQLGGLRRAVERRVEQKATQSAEDRVTKATLIPPTFDNTMVELTAERLDRYIAAMEKRKAALASNRQQYDRLRAQAAALEEEAARVDNPRERAAFEQAATRYSDCRSALIRSMEQNSERQMQALQQRMQSNPVAAQNDPKMKEMTAIMQTLAAAQESGDTAGVRRATERMANAFGTSVDSAAIDRKAAPTCGARPMKPRSAVLADSLHKKAEQTDRSALGLMKPSGVRGADLGVTDAQAAMIEERLQSWMNGVRDDAPITRTFSKAEYDAMLSRRDALKKARSSAE